MLVHLCMCVCMYVCTYVRMDGWMDGCACVRKSLLLLFKFSPITRMQFSSRLILSENMFNGASLTIVFRHWKKLAANAIKGKEVGFGRKMTCCMNNKEKFQYYCREGKKKQGLINKQKCCHEGAW
jgi:hypothetical protein